MSTREEAIAIFGLLSAHQREKISPKGAWGLAKNKKLAQAEFDLVEEARKNIVFPSEIEEYEKERIALCEEIAEKDENGNPIQVPRGAPFNDSVYKITTKNQVELTKKLDVLKNEKYKEAFAEKEEIDKKFTELLKEEREINWHKIKLADFPQAISVEEMEGLLPLVWEEEDDK